MTHFNQLGVQRDFVISDFQNMASLFPIHGEFPAGPFQYPEPPDTIEYSEDPLELLIDELSLPWEGLVGNADMFREYLSKRRRVQ